MLYTDSSSMRTIRLYRQLPLLLCLIAVVGCSASVPQTSEPVPPSWYHHLPTESGRIIGYGTGDSYRAAKHEALADLSEQREASVNSQFALLRKSDRNNATTSSIRTIQVESEKRLLSVKDLKQVERSGIHYVALGLDIRPTPQIMAEALQQGWQGDNPRSIQWQGSPYILQGQLIREIEARLQFNPAADHDYPAHVALNRENGRWILSINSVVQPLNDLSHLLEWSRGDVAGYGLQLLDKPTPRLNNGEPFTLVAQQPQGTHFLTLINIYSDGRLTITADNRRVQTTTTIPAEGDGLELIATPLNPNQSDRDLYLALWSQQPIDTTPFMQTQYSIAETEQGYQLHRLLPWIEQQPLLAMHPLYIEIQP